MKKQLSRIGLLEREVRLLCMAGLANRLAALTQAKIDAERRAMPLRIKWLVSPVCGADFAELLGPDIPRFVSRPTRTDALDDPHAVCPARPGRVPLKWVNNYDLCEAWTTDGFAGDDGSMRQAFKTKLQTLVPHPDVRKQIETLGDDWIGAHIRRTDLPLQERSPEGWYINQLRTFLDTTDGRVFLCSDDASVRKTFREYLGSRVFCYDVQLDPRNHLAHRQTVAGMREGLRDLLTLSQCRVILGTYNSSFSWLASVWGGGRLVMPGRAAGR